jgi:hypothetical protein
MEPSPEGVIDRSTIHMYSYVSSWGRRLHHAEHDDNYGELLGAPARPGSPENDLESKGFLDAFRFSGRDPRLRKCAQKMTGTIAGSCSGDHFVGPKRL